jgi:hypothetical protein
MKTGSQLTGNFFHKSIVGQVLSIFHDADYARLQ